MTHQDWMTPTLKSVQATLQAMELTLAPLQESDANESTDSDAWAGTSRLSIAPDRASSLLNFLQAHGARLRSLVKAASKSQAEIDSTNDARAKDAALLTFQGLVDAEHELHEAIQFIEHSFLLPRLTGSNSLALEVADWMSISGCARLRKGRGEGRPIEPLAVEDSRLSPAVWSPGQSLRLPSLFTPQAGRFKRSEDGAGTSLSHFPVICLPSRMARTPELFPLLSHELGHAVDADMGWTDALRSQLERERYARFWSAWMSEIVADVAGIAISGTAFGLALRRYTRFLNVPDDNADSSNYPAISLRLAFIRVTLESLGESSTELLDSISDLNIAEDEITQGLLVSYKARVLPELIETIIGDVEAWRADQVEIRKLARLIVDQGPEALRANDIAGENIHWLPSALMLAVLEDGRHDAHVLLERARPVLSAPGWLRSPERWEFVDATLPSMRATSLGPDGRTKIPPLNLLIDHEEIAFIGATHGQLLKLIQDAASARQGRPWTRLNLYFADDSLLQFVERDENPDLRIERDRAIKDFTEFLEGDSVASSWMLATFNAPPTFGSYWDWESRGGRVHVSSQIAGIDLRRCPGQDYVWADVAASGPYRAAVAHLDHIHARCIIVRSSG